MLKKKPILLIRVIVEKYLEGKKWNTKNGFTKAGKYAASFGGRICLTAKGERMEYEKMLDRLYMTLPKEALSKERFEMPIVDSFNQGQKTVIKNFSAILKTMRRDEKQFLKWLTKEIAVPANTEENRLILGGKFSQNQLQQAIETFIKNFVLCKECNRPDTKIVDRQGVKMLHCEACGALQPVKGI